MTGDIFWTLRLTGRGSRSVRRDMPEVMAQRLDSEFDSFGVAQGVGALVVSWAQMPGLSFTVVAHLDLDGTSKCVHGVGCRHDL